MIIMRNPNGYGSVVKLSGNRRRPYCVRKTKERDVRGYPVYVVLGYYKTRQEGMIALAEYNRDPYDVDLAKITMKELYDKWLARETSKNRLSKASIAAAKTSFGYCAALHNTAYKKIKAYQMQETIDGCGKGYATQGAIKTFWKNLDLFALELEVIIKKNSELTTSATILPTSKQPFTEDEINILWSHSTEPWVDTVLIIGSINIYVINQNGCC